MNIHYNKKGILIISIIFVLSVLINLSIQDYQGDWKWQLALQVASTVGIFMPYFLILLINFAYNLIKSNKIVIYSDWRISFLLIVLELLVIYDNIEKDNQNNNVALIKTPNFDMNKFKTLNSVNLSFKQFLKENDIDINISIPNKYETIQPYNKYSNHYFNVTTDFPDNWEYDRGVSEYSIYRTFQPDSALTLALIAVPVNSTTSNEIHSEFQSAPLNTMNKLNGGAYKNYLLKELTNNTTKQVYDFEFKEKKIRTTNYLIYSYKYNETYKELEIQVICVGHITILWGVIYTIHYNAPYYFYDSKLIEQVMKRTNFTKPDFNK